jgi:hypothetical protein
MTNQKKLEVIEEAFNYYHDRNSLTSKDEKELLNLVNELYAVISVTRCSARLLCVNSSVDGLTAGKYKKLHQDRTHTKVLDDYGIETMYFSDRFIKPPSQQ